MLLRFSKITLLLSAVGLLAACSSIANKSPDEMVRYGIQRTLMQDNQYNFTGEYRVKITPSAIDEAKTQADQTDQTPKETSTPTDEPKEKTAAVSAENNTQKQHKNKQTKQSNNYLKRHKTSVSHQPSTEAESDEAQQEKTDEPIISLRTQKFIADHVTVPYTGAVDLRHGRIELIPEIRYQTRNALVNMKLPMQVSIPDRAFMIDPAAVAPWSDATKAKSDAVIEDKYLLFQLPHDVSQTLPLKQLIYAIPKAIDDGVATIDKQAFTQVPLDNAGRHVGAHYRVQLNITDMQHAQMTLAIFKSLSEQLKRDEALDKQNPQTKTANYASIQDILQVIDQLLSAYMKQDDQTTHALTQQRIVVDFYLDRRGRIVACRQIVDLDVGLLAELLGHNKMKVISWTQLDYTAHPKFTLDPHSKNVIDLYQRYLDHKPLLTDDAANTDKSVVEKMLPLRDKDPARTKTHAQ